MNMSMMTILGSICMSLMKRTSWPVARNSLNSIASQLELSSQTLKIRWSTESVIGNFSKKRIKRVKIPLRNPRNLRIPSKCSRRVVV